MPKQRRFSTKPSGETGKNSEKPVGYFELILQNPNFRWLWGGQVISLLGDWFNLIALATLVVQLSRSGFAVGILFTIRMLAPFVIAPIAGMCADRYNRKHLLIITDIARGFIVFGFLFVREGSDIWLLYTLATLLFAVSGFFSPARSAILPDITSPRELGAANAFGAATWAVMYGLGAAMGGLVTGLFGSQTAFIIDGLTFFISASILLKIKLSNPPSTTTGNPTYKQRLTVFRYMFRHPDVLFIAMHKAAIIPGFQVLQVEIAKNYFTIGVGGALSLGMMYCMNGIGGGLGPILARYWTGDQNKLLRISITLGYLIGAFGLVITAPLFNLPTVLFGGAIRSLGNGIIWVFSTQLLFKSVPNEIRGRIFGSEIALYTLVGGIGTAIIGVLLDHFQVQPILWAMAALPLFPGVLWSLWQKRLSM